MHFTTYAITPKTTLSPLKPVRPFESANGTELLNYYSFALFALFNVLFIVHESPKVWKIQFYHEKPLSVWNLFTPVLHLRISN